MENENEAQSTRIRILLNPNTFLSGYAFRPHVSGESNLRIRKLLNPPSRVETFESDIFSDTCGRSSPDTFESDDVQDRVQNNMAANQVGVSNQPSLLGVRPRYRSK